MIKKWIKVTILLFILWIILSGRMEMKFLVMGIVSSGIIGYICLPSLEIESDVSGQKYFLLDIKLYKLIKYSAWLFIEIIKASYDVAKAVLSPKMKIDPQVIQFERHYKNPLATTTLINSIILTPGTVTVDVSDDNVYTVHALTDNARNGLLEGSMQRKIAELFNEQ